MGIELALACIPCAKLTEERMLRLHEIVDAAALNDLDSLSQTDSSDETDVRGFYHDHVDKLKTAEGHWREVFRLYLPDCPYVVLITGGPSYGEPPTDLYPTFSVIEETPTLWIQLADWARQDR